MTIRGIAGGLLAATVLICLEPALPAGARAETANDVRCSGCVGKKDIGKKAVRARNMGKNSIGSYQLKAGAVGPIDLAAGAKPAGAAAAETSADTVLNPASTDIVLHTVTLTVPGPGMVLATGSLYIDLQGAAGRFACTVDMNPVIGGHYTAGEAADGQVPVNITRAFEVDAPGDVTVHLLCREVTGNVAAHNPKLVAWFVPGRY